VAGNENTNMQKIKLKYDVSETDGTVYFKGMVYEVENNVAHRLIDQQLAELFKGFEEAPRDKMIKRKKVKIK
jgi:hypothetical protein